MTRPYISLNIYFFWMTLYIFHLIPVVKDQISLSIFNCYVWPYISITILTCTFIFKIMLTNFLVNLDNFATYYQNFRIIFNNISLNFVKFWKTLIFGQHFPPPLFFWEKWKNVLKCLEWQTNLSTFIFQSIAILNLYNVILISNCNLWLHFEKMLLFGIMFDIGQNQVLLSLFMLFIINSILYC